MVQTDSRFALGPSPGSPIPSCGASSVDEFISLGQDEQTERPFPLGDAPECTLPGWDNPWVDLGGEA